MGEMFIFFSIYSKFYLLTGDLTGSSALHIENVIFHCILTMKLYDDKKFWIVMRIPWSFLFNLLGKWKTRTWISFYSKTRIGTFIEHIVTMM